ncbi:MAG: hypothetical protein LCH60_11830 [Actinobacteria bacterium]|nr:hypothetical protein [Actinomycetota bacterium]
MVGTVLRALLGLLVAGAALFLPRLSGAGSWTVAWRWAPDITVGAALLGLLGVALVIRAALARGRLAGRA